MAALVSGSKVATVSPVAGVILAIPMAAVMIFFACLRPTGANPLMQQGVTMSARRILAVLFVCLLTPLTVFAQSSTGSISGTITDDSGGALPGVTVTATNVATSVARTAVSN